MKTTRELTIGEHHYTIHHFGASEGLKLGLELGRKVAPVMAAFVELAPDVQAGQGPVITADLAERAARALVEHIDPDQTVDLIKRLLKHTEVKGVGLLEHAFEAHFIGRLGDLVPLLKAVVEHNFSDFFSGVAAKVQAGRATAGRAKT